VIGIGAVVKAKPDGYYLQMGSVGANVTPAAVQKDLSVRSAARLCAGRDGGGMVGDPGGEEGSPGQHARRVRHLRQGAARRAQLRHHRLRQLRPSRQRVFMQQTGIAMQHVQYKGGSLATTDLMAGTIDAHMMSSAVGAGQAENPKLKMLAVASPRRLPSIPNVPTMAEAGVPAST
jgi:hypothetical protein